MVRRPLVVWPGLDGMDLHRKPIAGDGNCLFASLSDQLYGSPDKHLEVRASIIEYMRVNRIAFEGFASKDDIQQKRATRATTQAIRNTGSEDAFEDYLTIMSRAGTYGGEPELIAFVQSYDQDVLVHLRETSIPYTNATRSDVVSAKPQLHLCYGDEASNPHYDSARRNKPLETQIALRPYIDRSRSDVMLSAVSPPGTKIYNSRAIRNSRSDISQDMMHEFIVKGHKDLRTSFDSDRERARSPSVTSSHHSSSSKRSLDDDEGDSYRVSKRPDRRKSTRTRAVIDTVSLAASSSLKLNMNNDSDPATPASTQESECPSDRSEVGTDSDNKYIPEPRSNDEHVKSASTDPVRKTLMLKKRVTSESILTTTIVPARTHSPLRA